MRQTTCQKFIYKIHSERLRKNKWNLTLTSEEARRNEEVVSLADSQVLTWIDEINGVDYENRARAIKSMISRIKSEASSPENKREIRKLYSELDKIQLKSDYMCLVIDRDSDYIRACKGFKINGISYKRLLGTVNGIKNSTIVFVSDKVHAELNRRIENGRDESVPLVTAKLEAYKALTCSASVPVSMPKSFAVVSDAETSFMAKTIYITDDCDGEPEMEPTEREIVMDASDGFGLISPQLAERWSEELGLDYVISGVNTRFSWEKGMMFTFDYVEFARDVAGTYESVDAWGNKFDVREVEAIFTVSMVKLWNCYNSCEEYVKKSMENHYQMRITKACPKNLESERELNYQFIQPFDLDDDDIDELIEPTMTEIDEILSGDWRKAVLFMKGANLTDNGVSKLPDDYVKALMIDSRLHQDPFVQGEIRSLIRKRINDAKVGVIKVHGNYSIASGDPYLLCQHIFGLEKTGLLKAGEIYNKYWADINVDDVVCFRAPMSAAENIRKVKVRRDDDVRRWYRYMNTCAVLNGFDTVTMAENGMDYDGDLLMITDNAVLLKRYRDLPAIECVQRKAEKRISTEGDFINSNIASFGNEIGQTTNKITSMYEVRAGYEPGSIEYDTLTYRIRCGQLYQQNVIDKAKGVVARPMPREWYDRHHALKIDDESKRALYMDILAEKKPYFMRYIYPALMKQYNKYVKNTNKNSLREFKMSIKELESINEDELSDRQSEFLRYYRMYIPVGTRDCVMNKICKRFEDKFDGYIKKNEPDVSFDYSILKGDGEYTTSQFKQIKNLCANYNRRLVNYSVFASIERVNEDDASVALKDMNDEFLKECSKVCPDSSSLCNIVLDLCYSRSSTKRFAWNMCAGQIINNLMKRNGGIILYPKKCDDGDISYCGDKFRVVAVNTMDYKE